MVQIINGLEFEKCNKALIRVYEKYDKVKIDNLIDEAPFISEKHKEFYKYMLDQRFKKILEPAYKRIKEMK